MHTTDNQGTNSGSLVAVFLRDVALLWKLAGMLVGYVFKGGRIRREVRRAGAQGKRYYVDEPTRRGS